MALLRCENLTLGYEHQVLLENLSLNVAAGDYLCVLGENGAGKSTLMKAMLGLKKPMRGRVVLGDGMRQTDIGYLPQQTAAQRDFPASVMEVVLSGCLHDRGLRPFYGKKEREMARAQLERLGILSRAEDCYRDLSGGQQRRVLLARALCAAKKLLVLDEPTAGLDPVATAEMYQIVKELNEEGLTIVMVTHDVDGALHYARHILHVQKGHVCFGDRDAFLHNHPPFQYLLANEKAEGGTARV